MRAKKTWVLAMPRHPRNLRSKSSQVASPFRASRRSFKMTVRGGNAQRLDQFEHVVTLVACRAHVNARYHVGRKEFVAPKRRPAYREIVAAILHSLSCVGLPRRPIYSRGFCKDRLPRREALREDRRSHATARKSYSYKLLTLDGFAGANLKNAGISLCGRQC
jgi:hypothetical protein